MDGGFCLAKKIDGPNKIIIPADICEKYGINKDTGVAFYLKENNIFIKLMQKEDIEKTDG